MKDALETTDEITKLIKCSPHREAFFQSLKEKLPAGCAGIKVLSPMRWIVKADALLSITNNFKTLKHTWEEVVEVEDDIETSARICFSPQ